MATITPKSTTPPVKPNLESSHQTVRSPLRELRGKIRRYVITEAVATLIVSVALAFWVLLLLDFGCYYLFGFDWINFFPTWFRGMLLGGTLGLVCFFVELRKAAKLKRYEPDSNEASKSVFERLAENPILLFGLAVPLMLLYLGAWIFIGVLRDQGTLPGRWLAIAIALGLVSLAVVIVVKRMMYEFRDVALAMVLERRYPRLLGDRLLTAVELADLKKAEEQGYSRELIVHTIHEAAERVKRLDASQVLGWPRLYWRVLSGVLLTAGAYVAALALISTVGVAKAKDDQNVSVAKSYHQFNDASHIWFERTVLLNETRWPTRLQLEILIGDSNQAHDLENPHYVGAKDLDLQKALSKDFKSLNELKSLGVLTEDERLPNRQFRVRPVQWVMREVNEAGKERWRALQWKDLSTVLKQPISGLDDLKVPAAWINAQRYPPKSDDEKEKIRHLSLDELQLRDQDARESGGEWAKKDGWKESAETLGQVLAALESQVATHPMSLKVRKMDIPEAVGFQYVKENKQTVIGLEKVKTWEVIFHLKSKSDKYVLGIPQMDQENVPFEVVDGRYEKLSDGTETFKPGSHSSQKGSIITQENPRVKEKTIETVVPAYLFYDLSGFWPFDEYLTQLKQKKESKNQFRVYQGGDVDLTSTLDRKVTPVMVETTPPLAGLNGEMEGEKQLHFRIKNLREEIKLRFLFRDEKNLLGWDQIPVRVDTDQQPHRAGRPSLTGKTIQTGSITATPFQILRYVRGSTYRVTPQAILPFALSVEDDYGLYSLNYKFSVEQQLDKQDIPRQAVRAVGLLGMGVNAGASGNLDGRMYQWGVTYLLREFENQEGAFPIPRAARELAKQRAHFRDKDIEKLLSNPNVEDYPLFKRLEIKEPASWYEPGLELDTYLRVPDPTKYDIRDLEINEEARNELTGLDLRRALPTLKADPDKVQRTFLVRVRVEATDNNVDAVTRGFSGSKEWTFEVVPEGELLRDIRNDELKQFAELEKVYKELDVEYKKMERDLELLGQPIDYDPNNREKAEAAAAPLLLISQGMEMLPKLDESEKKVSSVHAAYLKLYLEMRTNRIGENPQLRERSEESIVVETWKRILQPMSKSPPAEVIQADQAVQYLLSESKQSMRDFQLSLLDVTIPDVEKRRQIAYQKGKLAMEEVEKLMRAIFLVMDRIRGFVTEKEVEAMLEKIANGQRAQVKIIDERVTFLKKVIFGSLLDPPEGGDKDKEKKKE